MRGDAAGVSGNILVITYVAIAVAVAFLIVAAYLGHRVWVWGVAVLVSVGVLWTYLTAPIGYEVSGDKLVVRYHLGATEFGPVASYHPVLEPVSFAVRVWGNGGLFAVTGRFYNRAYGMFRAYVTDPKRLVMVEMVNGEKILISPANSEAWVLKDGS